MEVAHSKAQQSGNGLALAALVRDCGERNPFSKFLGEMEVGLMNEETKKKKKNINEESR